MVRVWHHKTVEATSSANIFLREEVTKVLDNYVKHLRPTTSCRNLFGRQSGHSLQAKYHSVEMASLGKDLVVKLPCATQSRKLTSSKAVISGADAEEVAKAMSHSSTITKRHYNNVGRRSAAHEAFHVIQGVLISQKRPGDLQ